MDQVQWISSQEHIHTLDMHFVHMHTHTHIHQPRSRLSNSWCVSILGYLCIRIHWAWCTCISACGALVTHFGSRYIETDTFFFRLSRHVLLCWCGLCCSGCTQANQRYEFLTPLHECCTVCLSICPERVSAYLYTYMHTCIPTYLHIKQIFGSWCGGCIH